MDAFSGFARVLCRYSRVLCRYYSHPMFALPLFTQLRLVVLPSSYFNACH